MSLPKIEISWDEAEKLVLSVLTDYLDDLTAARDSLKSTNKSTNIHSADIGEELRELKKDIKALRRVRSYYEC